MVNPFLSFRRGSRIFAAWKNPAGINQDKRKSAPHSREQCNPSGADPRMFAIGRRSLCPSQKVREKGSSPPQPPPRALLSGCKHFIEFGDPEGLLATGAQQRIIIGRDNALNDLPNFYLPSPFNRFFNRVTRTNRFLHLLIEARASGPSSWMGNREEDATWSRIKRTKEGRRSSSEKGRVEGGLY